MPRITKTYVAGSGDQGYSTVLEGHTLRKDHPACAIQGDIESLRHEIETVLCETALLQPELTYLLEWLDRNIFSLASFCYLKGSTTTHCLPEDLLDFLVLKTRELQQQVGDCQDFLSQSHKTLVMLDGVRIEARALERSYTAWRFSDEIAHYQLAHTELISPITMHGAILNRLSAYLFQATRKEAKLLREAGFEINERPWMAALEPFVPFEIEA